MKRIVSIGSAVMFALLFQYSARASLSLSLSSNVPDLDHLAIGQPVSIRVDLSGIESPTGAVDFLAATIGYDEASFGPATIVAGSIVPDITGFQTAVAPGLADANYDALFADSHSPISSNGTFFEFDVLAIGLGSGSFGLTFVSAVIDTGEVSVESGPILSFRVVPEPASALMLLGSLLALALVRRR